MSTEYILPHRIPYPWQHVGGWIEVLVIIAQVITVEQRGVRGRVRSYGAIGATICRCHSQLLATAKPEIECKCTVKSTHSRGRTPTLTHSDACIEASLYIATRR